MRTPPSHEYLTARILSRRRENLGISQARLAQMAGVSLPTVQRFLSRRHSVASFETACRLAEALGLSLSLEETLPEEQLIAQQARQRARQLAAMVQGTSSLEAQGLSAPQLAVIENQFVHELLKGSRARLWND